MGSGGDPQLGRGRVAISGDYISDACRGEAEATCDWSGSSVLSESNSSVLGLSDVDLVWPELTVVWPGRRKPIEVRELEASLPSVAVCHNTETRSPNGIAALASQAGR